MNIYKIYKKTRSSILVYLTHKMALPLLKIIRRPEKFRYTLDDLRRFPEGSLGYDLGTFITSRKIVLLPAYARHDMKHLLLDYDTTDEGEALLQFFMLGNGHVSFPVLATVAFGLVTMPEHFLSFKTAFRRGRSSIPISHWNWPELVHENTRELKLKINRSYEDRRNNR